MLKIVRDVSGSVTTIRLIGRVQVEHLDELRRALEGTAPTELDLDEVTLVDVQAVRFIAAAERAGIVLRHCAPFIREWMEREHRRLD